MFFPLSFKVCIVICDVAQLFLCLTPCLNAFRLHCSALFTFFAASTPSLLKCDVYWCFCSCEQNFCLNVSRVLPVILNFCSMFFFFFLTTLIVLICIWFSSCHTVWELEQTPPSLGHPMLSLCVCNNASGFSDVFLGMFFFHTQPHIKISTHGRSLWLMWKIRMNRTPELIKLCILASVTTLAGILPKGSKMEKKNNKAVV